MASNTQIDNATMIQMETIPLWGDRDEHRFTNITKNFTFTRRINYKQLDTLMRKLGTLTRETYYDTRVITNESVNQNMTPID